jgi:phosphate transport system permease protein
LCKSAALLVIGLAILLTAVLTWKSWDSITTNGIGFFTDEEWDPEPTHRVFGALAFLYGTIVSSALAMLIAVPLGVGTATYLAEIAPGWLRTSGSFLVEMLAAIPSIVYGFWGMFFLAPYLRDFMNLLGGENLTGLSMFSAGVVLAIMIVPYVAAVSYDACRAVPRSQREGALALGATRWQMIRSVVLPYARPGIFAACLLALGRAVGETMAVTMLIGNRPEISTSLFDPGYSIAAVIANEFTEATYPLYLSALTQLGLVLFLVTGIFNLLGRLLIWRMGKVGGRRSLLGSSLAGAFRLVTAPLRWLFGQSAKVVNPFSLDSRPGAKVPGKYETDHVPRSKSAVALLIDRLMTGVLSTCMLVVLIPLFLILGYLVFQGVEALDWDFFFKTSSGPGESGGGMANALYGSFLLVGTATLFATPIGLLAAIYLAEYRGGWLSSSARFIGELLAGVPSIVMGIFAYTLIAHPLKLHGWSGVFALAVMMIPIVMRASEESLKLVPRSLRDGSYALGASQWQTVVRVTVPAALSAIITGVCLAVSRIAGETAPLVLTAGDNLYAPTSLADFTPSLPQKIFVYAMSPYDNWHRQAWAAALVLLSVVMLLNFGIRYLTGRRTISASRAD